MCEYSYSYNHSIVKYGDDMEKTVSLGIKNGDSLGIKNGDIADSNEFVIQAAIDYLSYIGGGTVKIDEGVFHIGSAIHLRSNVDLEGMEGKTVFRKCSVTVSPLVCDADLHESQITLRNPGAFRPGQTVTVKVPETEGFMEETVAVITGMEGNVCYLDRELYKTYLLSDGPVVETSFPVISGYGCRDIRIRNIVIDGNKQNNNHASAQIFCSGRAKGSPSEAFRA
jgi:hypothetical protein